jgi:hypothetical protein
MTTTAKSLSLLFAVLALAAGLLLLGPSAAPAAPSASVCSDGLDNDGDGKADFPVDTGCGSANSDSEADEVENEAGEVRRACSDGVDNDTDGKVDYPADPGCGSPNSGEETDEADENEDEAGDDRGRDRNRASIQLSDDRCGSGKLVATVRGRRMSGVALAIDGERVATRGVKSGRTAVRVTLDDVDSGAHRLVARVRTRGSRTVRTLRVRFGSCGA